MIRSKEVMRSKGIKIGKPEMHHMTVMPHEKGVTVKHHSGGTHEFGKGDGDKFAAHMMEHSGVSYKDGTGGNDVDKEGTEAE